jgi:hypothetical protein
MILRARLLTTAPPIFFDVDIPILLQGRLKGSAFCSFLAAKSGST